MRDEWDACRKIATPRFEHSHFAYAGTFLGVPPSDQALLLYRQAASGSHRQGWRACKTFGRGRYHCLGERERETHARHYGVCGNVPPVYEVMVDIIKNVFESKILLS